MPPLPKKKHTRARKGNRNAHNAMKLPALSICGGCGEVAQPHITCPECGNYKGRTMPGNWDRVNQLEQVTPVAAASKESESL